MSQSSAFEALVVEALESLPPQFARLLDHVEVLVIARPTRSHRRAAGVRPWQTLYGLYEGTPLTERSDGAALLPDTITLFREPLMRDFPQRDRLRAEVRQTVLHEIAHAFGISDARLHELDAY